MSVAGSRYDFFILVEIRFRLWLRRDEFWVADPTHVAATGGFAYAAAPFVAAWLRRVVGYAISRWIDGRLAAAALETAIPSRRPGAGRVHPRNQDTQSRTVYLAGYEGVQQRVRGLAEVHPRLQPPQTSLCSASQPFTIAIDIRGPVRGRFALKASWTPALSGPGPRR